MSSNAITLSASALKTISKRVRVPNYKRDGSVSCTSGLATFAGTSLNIHTTSTIKRLAQSRSTMNLGSFTALV